MKRNCNELVNTMVNEVMSMEAGTEFTIRDLKYYNAISNSDAKKVGSTFSNKVKGYAEKVGTKNGAALYRRN